MAKKNKINEKGVLVSLSNDGDILLTSEIEEELLTENLTQKILELGKEFGSLSIQVKDYAPRQASRKPVYKYVCPECSKEIKSSVEELHCICKECNREYEEK